MKKYYKLLLILVVFTFSVIISSCKKDDDFHSISTIETEIHNKVNDYRSFQGLSTLVMQPLAFEEARKISDKLANGTYQSDDPQIQSAVENFASLLGGTNHGSIIMTSNIENADSIVNTMLDFPSIVEIIERDYTQSGVGVSESTDGIFHICHLFVNIPN